MPAGENDDTKERPTMDPVLVANQALSLSRQTAARLDESVQIIHSTHNMVEKLFTVQVEHGEQLHQLRSDLTRHVTDESVDVKDIRSQQQRDSETLKQVHSLLDDRRGWDWLGKKVRGSGMIAVAIVGILGLLAILAEFFGQQVSR